MENRRLYSAEDRSVCADAQRQHQRCDQRESGLLPQHSQAVAQVLEQVPYPPCPASVATHLLHLLRTAERKTGLASCILGTIALSNQVARMLVQMEAQLLYKLLFTPPSAKQAMQPRHLAPPSDILRIKLMACGQSLPALTFGF